MQISEAIFQFNQARRFKRGESTVKGYDLVLRQFCLYMHDAEIEAVTDQHVAAWFNLQTQLGWDKVSFIPKAVALRKFFEYWHKKGLDVLDPWFIEIPKKEYKFPHVLDEDNFKQLLQSVPKTSRDPRHIRNLAFIGLLWDTGARNGELCALNLEDLNTVTCFTAPDQNGDPVIMYRARIKTEKSRGTKPFRELFWFEETNDALKKWLKKRKQLTKIVKHCDPQALFISISGGKTGQRITIRGIGEALRRYSVNAKLPTYANAHSFRHHRARDIIENGGTNSDVMNVLGHATLASSSIYTMMHDEQLAKRVAFTKGLTRANGKVLSGNGRFEQRDKTTSDERTREKVLGISSEKRNRPRSHEAHDEKKRSGTEKKKAILV